MKVRVPVFIDGESEPRGGAEIEVPTPTGAPAVFRVDLGDRWGVRIVVTRTGRGGRRPLLVGDNAAQVVRLYRAGRSSPEIVDELGRRGIRASTTAVLSCLERGGVEIRSMGEAMALVRGKATPRAAANSGPYPCPRGCGRSFDWAPAAAAHGRACGKDKSRIIARTAKKPVPKPKSVGPYLCAKGCGRIFNRAGPAALHARWCDGVPSPARMRGPRGRPEAEAPHRPPTMVGGPPEYRVQTIIGGIPVETVIAVLDRHFRGESPESIRRSLSGDEGPLAPVWILRAYGRMDLDRDTLDGKKRAAALWIDELGPIDRENLARRVLDPPKREAER